MDDFSATEWLESSKEALKQQTAFATTARDRIGQKPTKRTPDELAAAFEHRQPPSTAENQIRHTVLTYSYAPCLTPFVDLKPIFLADLVLETVHRGTVVTVRTVGDPQHNWAIQNVIEDSNGDRDVFSVYNFDLGMTEHGVLAKAAVFAIKEPCYKLAQDGFPTLMVTHPSDLVKLEDSAMTEPLEKHLERLTISARSMTAYKNDGNAAFKAKDYRQAVELYSKAPKADKVIEADLTRYDVLRNRALANIHLGRFDQGLADAEASILPPDVAEGIDRVKFDSKAFYRAGVAAYYLQNFVHAEECFRQVLELSPQDVDAQRELERTSERLIEQQTGEYDFLTMAEVAAAGPKLLDHASYTALVEIKDTKDRGHGLFAKQDIKPGELVLCEKAFAIGFKSDTAKDFNMLLNINTGSTTTGPNLERLCNAVTKLQHNPQLAKGFACLYNGDYRPETIGQVDGVVDVFQVEAALQYNGFCCPVKPTGVEYEAYDEWSSAGLWLNVAAINHDCIGNVNSSFIGDMMIVRATQDIAAGEEMLVRYHMDDDFEQFQADLQTSWKFNCTCRLCEAERLTPKIQRERRLEAFGRAKVLMAINPHSPGREMPSNLVKEAERLRDLIAATYDPEIYGSLPRKCLFELSHWITQAYCLDPMLKTRPMAQYTLQCLGVKLTLEGGQASVDYSKSISNSTGVAAMMYIATTYKVERHLDMAVKIEAYAEEMYEVLNGSTFGFREKHT